MKNMIDKQWVLNMHSHPTWRDNQEYIDEATNELKEYFNVEKFITDHEYIAQKQVIETLIADAWNDANDMIGELDYTLARILSIPLEEVLDYRTQFYWDDLNADDDEEEE